LSTGQLIVTIAFVGLLGALHLLLRAARVPAGGTSVLAPPSAGRRDPIAAVLVLGALAALVFAGVAFVVSVVDDEDEATRPTSQATTTAPTTSAAPPPPQPPPLPAPEALEPPEGTALVARVVAEPDGSIAAARNAVGAAPRVMKRENGVYAVNVPGLAPELQRRAVIRARPANGAPGVMVSARKVGPEAEFVVFTRDAQTGAFAETGFEFAAFVPKQDLESAAGEEQQGRPQLPGTR
jgi:hypothetical protein